MAAFCLTVANQATQHSFLAGDSQDFSISFISGEITKMLHFRAAHSLCLLQSSKPPFMEASF